MPEISGYEADFSVRQAERSAAGRQSLVRHIYIIAITANAEADNRSKCGQAGMDDYINRPVELSELEAAIHRGLADCAARKAIEEVLDPIVIARLRQLRTPGRSDPVIEPADLFLEEAPAQLEVMELAIEEDGCTSLSRAISAATSPKGSSGNLGGRDLAALCDEIEQAAKNWSPEEAMPLVQRPRQGADRLRGALEKVMRR